MNQKNPDTFVNLFFLPSLLKTFVELSIIAKSINECGWMTVDEISRKIIVRADVGCTLSSPLHLCMIISNIEEAHFLIDSFLFYQIVVRESTRLEAFPIL